MKTVFQTKLLVCLFVFLFVTTIPADAAKETYIKTERYNVKFEIIASGLNHPWSLAFLPHGDMLVTERSGQLRLVSKEGKLHPRPIGGLPFIHQRGQGGLLDIALHPQFVKNGLVYFSFVESGKKGVGTAVGRGRLDGHRLKHVEVIFRLSPKSNTHRHFGSRLVFDREGYLYITLGDRGDRHRAQDISDHAGSLIRIHDDGRIPKDNPFVNRFDAKGEIFSFGHRNMQGATLHPETGELWTHEHGPQGGDEINIPQKGKNYGWPVITYGVNYGFGTKIGEGTHKQGMEQPLYYWDPSIAPSGMTFYSGDAFKNWKGNLFVGSLKFKLLVRLELKGKKVVHEERMFSGLFGRIRDVRQGPDGFIYLLTDEDNGRLIRLKPVNKE